MKKIYVCLLLLGLSACVTVKDDVLGNSASQLQTRNYQSRSFDTTDRDLVLRSVISTMQDLGFIIDKADKTLGTISGTSYSFGASKLTVSIRKNGKQIIVRANAQKGLNAIDDPIPYQNFFESLNKSLFLEAHEVQ